MALTLRRAGWCAGGASISNAGSRNALVLSCTSARLANNWPGSDFGDFRCARSTRSPIRRRKTRLNKRRHKSRRGIAKGRARQAAHDRDEVWFRDEARVGQQGTRTRVRADLRADLWADRGTRPRAPRDTRYRSACISGAVCPDRAPTAARPQHLSCRRSTRRR